VAGCIADSQWERDGAVRGPEWDIRVLDWSPGIASVRREIDRVLGRGSWRADSGRLWRSGRLGRILRRERMEAIRNNISRCV
jgi:hypothetical protein